MSYDLRALTLVTYVAYRIIMNPDDQSQRAHFFEHFIKLLRSFFWNGQECSLAMISSKHSKARTALKDSWFNSG